MRSKTLKYIRQLTDSVDGWLGRREGPYLYALAQIGSQLGAVVEIGSWKGKSTIWLAGGCGSAPEAKFYAIDPHEHGSEEEFRRNMKRAGFDSLVCAIVKPSMEALKLWNQPIGLLWIDGDHRYESVKSDFLGWEPFVVEGGIIALHDTYSWEGVRRVVDEEILRSDRFKVLGQLDSILAVSKVARLSFQDRIKNSTTACLRRVYNHARAERKHWRALPRKLLRGLSSPRPPI